MDAVKEAPLDLLCSSRGNRLFGLCGFASWSPHSVDYFVSIIWTPFSDFGVLCRPSTCFATVLAAAVGSNSCIAGSYYCLRFFGVVLLSTAFSIPLLVVVYDGVLNPLESVAYGGA